MLCLSALPNGPVTARLHGADFPYKNKIWVATQQNWHWKFTVCCRLEATSLSRAVLSLNYSKCYQTWLDPLIKYVSLFQSSSRLHGRHFYYKTYAFLFKTWQLCAQVLEYYSIYDMSGRSVWNYFLIKHHNIVYYIRWQCKGIACFLRWIELYLESSFGIK